MRIGVAELLSWEGPQVVFDEPAYTLAGGEGGGCVCSTLRSDGFGGGPVMIQCC